MTFSGSLADILMRAGQSVAQDLDGLLRPLDLSLVQWRVLDSLSDGAGRTMTGLSARSAIQMSALSKLVDRMVVRSLVLRKQSERDQRVIIVMASDFGLEAYRKSLPAIQAYEAQLIERLAGFDAGRLDGFMLGAGSDLAGGRRQGSAAELIAAPPDSPARRQQAVGRTPSLLLYPRINTGIVGGRPCFRIPIATRRPTC